MNVNQQLRNQASQDHHERFMQHIANLVRENANAFPTSTTAWGVFCDGPGGVMQQVVDQVQTRLSSMGYALSRTPKALASTEP